MWDKQAVETYRVKTKLIIVIILLTIITTVSILNLKVKAIVPITMAHTKCRKSNTEIYKNIFSWENQADLRNPYVLLKIRQI